MKRTTLYLSVASTALAIGGQALAGVFTETYTGTVDSGFDEIGLFDAGGGDLTGERYIIKYTINTANGIFTNDPPINVELDGGAAYAASVPVTALIEINGVTQKIGGNYSSNVQSYDAEDNFVTPYNNYYAGDSYFGLYRGGPSGDYIGSYATSLGNPDLSGSFSPISIYNNGSFEFYSTYVYFVGDGFYTGTLITSGNLDGSGTAQLTGVPEPATWAMSLLGFSGIGAAMRSASWRRRVISASSAR